MRTEWHGPEDLSGKLYPINKFTKHPRNVRRGNVDVIARSLNKFGQMAPIVVQKSTGHIIKGNHTWDGMKFLGWEECAATIVDCDDEIAYHYLLADNKASDLADYDKAALARSLTELADAGKLGDTLWTADDLDDVQAAIGTIETLVQEFKGDYSDDPVDRQKRLERELTRVAPKMREVPIVVTVDQHRVLMENIKVLQSEYKTSTAIETILVAMQREADRARQNAPQAGDGTAAPVATAPAPVPAPQPDLAGQGGDEAQPAARVLDGYEVDEHNNLLPNGKAAVWAVTGNDVMKTIRATHTDPLPRTVMLGIIRAHDPVGHTLRPPVMERRRCVKHLVDAVIDSPLQEFTHENAAKLINRITEAGV
jgi:hypothetical protein